MALTDPFLKREKISFIEEIPARRCSGSIFLNSFEKLSTGKIYKAKKAFKKPKKPGI
jgi:hypothetical protein